MRILDRYVVREFLGPLAMSISAFVIIILSGQLFMLVDFIVQRKVPVLAVVRMLVYSLPGIVLEAGPIAVLFATMLGLGRLAKDSELDTIRAAGVSFARLALPLVVLGVAISGGLFTLGEEIVPRANHESQRIFREIVFGEAMPAVEQDVFFKAPGDRYFYVGQVNRDAGTISRVMIYETGSSTFPRLLTAARGRVQQGSWVLEDGHIHELDREGQVTMAISFDTLTVPMDETMEGFTSSQKEPSEMTRQELARHIDLFRRSGVRVSGLEVEYHLKVAQPFAALVFAVVGAPLVTKSPRHAGGYFGVVAASVLALAYYVFSAVCRSLAIKGTIPPLVAAWLPNSAFLALGVTLLRGAEWRRRTRRRGVAALALVALLLCAAGLALPSGASAAASSGTTLVRIRAEHIVYDGSDGLWTAWGGVETSFDDTVIRSDSAEMYVNLKTATFTGNVVIIEGSEELRGDAATLDLATGDVKVHGARAKLSVQQVEGYLYVSGDVLSRQGEDFHLEHASITSCELEQPHYRLEVEALDFYVDDRVVLHGVSYYEGQLRLARLPKLTIPLKEDEGFELPKIGWGVREGWYIRTVTNYSVNENSRGKLLLDYFQLLGPAMGISHRLGFDRAELDLSAYELFNRSTSSVDTTLQLGLKAQPEDGLSLGGGYTYRDYVSLGTPSEERTYSLSLQRRVAKGTSDFSFSHRRTDSAADSVLTTATLRHSSTVADVIRLTADGSYRLNRVGDEVKQNVVNIRAAANASVSGITYTALFQEQIHIDEEGDDESGEGSTPPPFRQLRRAPELTASVSQLKIGNLPVTAGAKLLFGVYREDSIRDGVLTEVASSKGEAEASLSLNTLRPASWLRLDASASARGSIYSFEDASRAGASFTASATVIPADWAQLRLTYSGSVTEGHSPFRFDQMSESSSVSASLTSSVGRFRLTAGASYDFLTGTFGAVTASASAAVWKGVTVEATGRFYPSFNSHNTATLKVTASPAPDLELKAGFNYDLTDSKMTRFESSASLKLGSDWRLQWAGIYDVVKGGIIRGDIGITKDLHCREVSLMYQHTTGRVWLEFRLKALPGMPIGFGLGEEGIIFK